MDLRTKISAALKQAMKDKDADRLSTLRLINAAIKDKDIDARAAGQDDGVGEGRSPCDPWQNGQAAERECEDL